MKLLCYDPAMVTRKESTLCVYPSVLPEALLWQQSLEVLPRLCRFLHRLFSLDNAVCGAECDRFVLEPFASLVQGQKAATSG